MGGRRPVSAVDQLIAILDLEPLERNLFRGRNLGVGWQRVFGGQVIAQALVAATRTVAENREPHSLHAYFLREGDLAIPILYEVERVRDGGSFSARTVKAIQHGEIIFTLAASFKIAEPGFEHQAPAMPDVPPPEELPSGTELRDRLRDTAPAYIRRYWETAQAVEIRPVRLDRYQRRGPHEPVNHLWLRAGGPLPADAAIHRAVLAFASDMTLLDTALLPHGGSIFDEDLKVASVDHSLWFHRPFRADDWLLFAQDSPSAARALGFSRGSLFTRDGTLVASVAQEGLIRRRPLA
ncbi:MAG: acyl-CoA thioesterase II [Bauldia sp.]|nr:acyl-CoA thioesterase II [Bauldia sp.]